MQELVRLVVNRTGLSHERATVVVRATLAFIKQKLPTHLAVQIDKMINRSDAPEDPIIHLGNSVGKKIESTNTKRQE